MKNILKIIIIFAFLSTLSCEKQKTENKHNLILSNVGYKDIALDSPTSNTDINFRLNRINNKEYISFFNRKNFSIDIYNYKTGRLFKKFEIENRGINKITTPFYSLDYYIYTLDSIFISTIKNYYLLNARGEILEKVTPVIESKYSKIKRPVFNETTNYKNGMLSFEIETDFPDKKEDTYLWRSYDFNKNIVTGNYINKSILVSNYNDVLNFKLLNLKKRGTSDKITIQFVKENNKLFASTAINDSVYIFDSNRKLIDTFYAGDKNIKIPGFIEYFKRKKITRMGIATAIEDELEQPPFYTNMFIDGKSRFIYRILIHGTKVVFNSTLLPEKEFSVLKGATLIAVNLDSKKLYTFKLPINEVQIPLDNSKIFFTNEGIHFPLIKQEKRNIIRYKILKLINKMKTGNSKFGFLPKKSHLIIIIISVLLLQNIDSLNLFKISTDKNSSISNEKKVTKLIDINIHISSNKEIKVNDKAVKFSDFKKVIWELTNKYPTQEVSGFIYNVYASNAVNMGFITDLFGIIETTQDYNFSIKRVLHHYK